MADGQDVKTPMASAFPVFEFKLAGEPQALYPGAFQKCALYETALNEVSFAYFRFFDKNAQAIEKIIRLANLEFKFRHGWVEGVKSAWINMGVHTYDVKWTPGGTQLDLWVTDSAGQDVAVRNAAYNAMTISRIVKKIADRHGWEHSIENTKDPVSLLQTNISDIGFLLKVLRPRALAAKTGRGDFRCYFENGNVLHFHPPRYELKDYKTYDVTKDSQHPISEYRYRANLRSIVQDGGYELRVEGYDPINKRVLVQDVSDNTTSEKYKMGPARDVVDLQGGLGSFIAVPFKDPDSVLAFAKQHWYSANIHAHPAHIRMRADPLIKPGKCFTIIAEPTGTGFTVQGSGRFLVESIVTTYSPRTAYEQRLLLARSAFKEQKAEVAGIVDAQNNNPNDASGDVTSFGKRDVVKAVVSYAEQKL